MDTVYKVGSTKPLTMSNTTITPELIQQRKIEGFTVQLKAAGYDDSVVRAVLPVYVEQDNRRMAKYAAIRTTILGLKAA